MSLFKNLAAIVAAPVQIIDKTIVEPIATLAEAAVDGFSGEIGDDK